MTPEAQRIAIAEFCGWKHGSHFEQILSTGVGETWEGWIDPTTDEWQLTPPDYLNDLNAMREAELRLSGDEWRIFLGFLGKGTIPRLMSMHEFRACWISTAAQRAEALLRTIGKWKSELK